MSNLQNSLKLCLDARQLAIDAQNSSVRHLIGMARARFKLEAEGCWEELQRDLDQCIRYVSFAQVKVTTADQQAIPVSSRSKSRSISDDDQAGNLGTSYDVISRKLQLHQYDLVKGIEAFASFQEKADTELN